MQFPIIFSGGVGKAVGKGVGVTGGVSLGVGVRGESVGETKITGVGVADVGGDVGGDVDPSKPIMQPSSPVFGLPTP